MTRRLAVAVLGIFLLVGLAGAQGTQVAASPKAAGAGWGGVVTDASVIAAAERAGTATSTQPAVESKEIVKDGVAVTVLVRKATVSADEQPEFIVRFKNVGTEYRNLYDVTAYWKWAIDLTNTDPKATDPGPWRLRMNALPGRAPIDHRQIQPGEGTDVTVNLNDPPFTFAYTYAGSMLQLVPPTRHLNPGHYRLTVAVALTNPFGEGYFEWAGPVTTDPIEVTITEATAKAATKEELVAYDAAIARVTDTLQPGGLWRNGRSPAIDLPKNAATEEVIDAAVNATSLDSKAYRVLRVQPFAGKGVPGAASGSAALLQVGKSYKVVILLPPEISGWWSRFYDTDLLPPPVPAPAAGTSRQTNPG